MNKKSKTKLSFGIHNLFNLEDNLIKRNKIPFNLNKIQSSISSLLFLNQKNTNSKNYRIMHKYFK